MHVDAGPAGRVNGAAARIGLVLGPTLALAVYFLLSIDQSVSHEARATGAIGTLMAIWWMTEATPLPATSLLPIVLFPITGVASVQDAASPYANKLIFLFMGGFMIALAVERWELHRRIALSIVSGIGTQPARLVGGFMVATALISMWISNTATTLMMLPIALSVVGLVGSTRDSEPGSSAPGPHDSPLAICLMLGVAYASSIGGVATLVGTPPNLYMASFLNEHYDIEIGFGRWMIIGVPLSALFLVLTWYLLTHVLFSIPRTELSGSRGAVREQLLALGRFSRGETTVALVAGFTASAWVVREPLANWGWLASKVPLITSIDDTMIALAGALALFLIPVDRSRRICALDWNTAKRLPWDVLLLFGGGLSLAAAITSSGLDTWIGLQLESLGTLPPCVLVVAVTAVVVFLTEITSNTATAAAFLPIVASLAMAVDPELLLLLVVPAAIASSYAFMLPVATPPNAIVFGTGQVTIGQMVRAGFWLNIMGIAIIPLVVYAFRGLLASPAP